MGDRGAAAARRDPVRQRREARAARNPTTSPASPTRCSRRASATRSRAGRVTPRPAIDAARRRPRWCSPTAASVPADLIVWATGYRVTFPFLDPELIAAQDNDLPLWKRTVHPDLPGLYFIGLVQAVGAVMPLAEAQGEWVAETPRRPVRAADGRRDPPPDAAPTTSATERQFYASARHTMEVDFDHYLWDLDRERRRGARHGPRRPRADVALVRDRWRPSVTGAGRGLGREIALRLRPRAGTSCTSPTSTRCCRRGGPGDRRRDRGGRLRLRARRPRPRGLPQGGAADRGVGPRPRPVGQQRRRAGHRPGVGAHRRERGG